MAGKECKSCIHYVQYYTKRGIRFYKMFNGHCRNRKRNGQYRPTDTICGFYTEKNAEKERDEQRKLASEYLLNVSERLNEIIEILKTQN